MLVAALGQLLVHVMGAVAGRFDARAASSTVSASCCWAGAVVALTAADPVPWLAPCYSMPQEAVELVWQRLAAVAAGVDVGAAPTVYEIEGGAPPVRG